MTSRLRSLALTSAAALALCAAGAPDAAATTLAALVGDNTLVHINIEKRRVVKRITVTGAGRLAAIDVRPANGQLYGLTTTGVFVINPLNGVATPSSTLSTALTSAQLGADFNPVVDRLRVVGTDDTNYRIDVTTGAVTLDPAVTFVAPNPFGGTSPVVTALAYTNSIAGAKATLLYDIDDATSALYLQLPANSGTLVPVGQLSVDLPASDIGFDIDLNTRNRNVGYVVANRRLWTIDLAGGTLTNVGAIKGLTEDVRDIAVLSAL